jgi:uncharacterized protein
MKIDIYTHILPSIYRDRLFKYLDRFRDEATLLEKKTALSDFEARLRILEDHDNMVQVVCGTLPVLEDVVDQKEAIELVRIANDGMAEWIARYPERCIAAVADLPLNTPDMAVREAERAVKELGFKGVQIYTSVQGKPLSWEELMPLYGLMHELDLPIWIHPARRSTTPDYPTEKSSSHQIFSIFGWPYETSAAMTRLVFAGIFEKFPGIKFITHHGGAMIPFFAGRILALYNNGLERQGLDHFPGLPKHPLDYFKMFYADTVLNGSSAALQCAYSFFGEDHLLFGSDMPYGVRNGSVSIREAIQSVEALNLPEASKKKIYEGNARRLLHLSSLS